MKQCNTCYITKNLSDFPKNPKMVEGYGNKCRSCMNEYYREHNKNKKVVNDNLLIKYLNHKVKNMKKQDERKFPNHIFDLTADDLKDIYNRQNGTCIYSNSKLSYKKNTSIYKKISFDRIDNNLPHTKSNLQMTSIFMNMFRGSRTDEEFRELINNSQ